MTVTNQSELDLAVRAVKKGQVALEKAGDGARKLDCRIGREWKVKADTLLESAMIPVLQSGCDYPILTEESGSLGGAGPRCWIVDPLDGSFNYLRGLPNYCISVGLFEGTTPVIGVVLDLLNNQLFKGIVGVGATCDGSEIKINKALPIEPSAAILCTGLPSGLDHSNDNLSEIVSLFRKFGKVRMLGSAALMLCYVAAGRCDSYMERRIGLWDVAAGLAIVAAAGGEYRLGHISADSRVDVEAACSSSLLGSEVYDQ